ncbi:MAG: redoxin family protein [Bacteroidetes bacterium]|jgi:thiol-disulfide isomerase/thioredoxin|nr:redoxin family protein [Bacteroidota bacterium]MBT3748338.1 redoxin family protein [Bacteroidota bacterium]MBT4410661.1 redoxin family protein [Bacteroidota bacterium]MBT5424567.1 redoxin family protein [Bacteroidota bacterium]MBT7464250.1 redoxin family protein [Bacteroidota bacterium]
MNHHLVMLSVFAVGICMFFSCCNKVPDDQIIVEYRIQNPDYETIDFFYSDVFGFDHKQVLTSSDTVVFDTVFTLAPMYLRFSTKESVEFYGEPGSHIVIDLDTGAFLSERINVTGNLRDMNNYLIRLAGFHDEMNWNGGFGRGLEPEAFLELLDSIRMVNEGFLETAKKRNPEHVFWTQQFENIKLNALSRMYYYPMLYRSAKGKYLPKEWYELVKPDYNYLLERPDLLDLGLMQSNLDAYIFNKSLALANKWTDENREALIEGSLSRRNVYEYGTQFVIDSVNNEEVRNFLLLDLAKRAFNRGELKPIENLLVLFKHNCTNNEYVEFVKKEEDSWRKLQPGELAPAVRGETPDGESRALSEFKGQFVFVDVWATSCGPCIGELPSFRELVKAYEDRNIIFIMYSMDDSREDWLNYLENNEMPGIQLISERGMPCDFSETYKFNGIPRYMLFDPDGNIIGTGLERPSYLKQIKYLDTSLDDPKWEKY